MNRYFNLSEFTQEPVLPLDIADKLLKYHIEVMNPVRQKLGKPIRVSQKSGYRSEVTEIKHKRSGKSEHCFRGKGAADYTCEDLPVLGRLLKDTPYTRICYYPSKGFYHCDYKATEQQLFICSDGYNWIGINW